MLRMTGPEIHHLVILWQELRFREAVDRRPGFRGVGTSLIDPEALGGVCVFGDGGVGDAHLAWVDPFLRDAFLER